MTNLCEVMNETTLSPVREVGNLYLLVLVELEVEVKFLVEKLIGIQTFALHLIG